MKVFKELVIYVLVFTFLIPQKGSSQSIQVVTDKTAVFNRGKDNRVALRIGEGIHVQDSGPIPKYPEYLDKHKMRVKDLVNTGYSMECPVRAHFTRYELDRLERLLGSYGHKFELTSNIQDLADQTLTAYASNYDSIVAQDVLMDWRPCDAVYAIMRGAEAGLSEYDKEVQAAIKAKEEQEKKSWWEIALIVTAVVVVVATAVYFGGATLSVMPSISGGGLGGSVTLSWGAAATNGIVIAGPAVTGAGSGIAAGTAVYSYMSNSDDSSDDVLEEDITIDYDYESGVLEIGEGYRPSMDAYNDNYQQIAAHPAVSPIFWYVLGIITTKTPISNGEWCSKLDTDKERNSCVKDLNDAEERRFEEFLKGMQEKECSSPKYCG